MADSPTDKDLNDKEGGIRVIYLTGVFKMTFIITILYVACGLVAFWLLSLVLHK